MCQDHRMGPITVFDKSALHGLNINEAVWFDSFFLANMVPVFYVETLADLEKEVAQGRTPEDLVGELAEKTPSSAGPNVHHSQLVQGELAGHRIEMTNGIVVDSGEVRRSPDGSVGVHVDEFPEATALSRWRNHDFLEIERTTARDWRAALAAHDTARPIGILKNILPADPKISDLKQLKEFIDSFCSSADPQVINVALDVLGVPDEHKRLAKKNWAEAGKPPLDQFAPYTTHVFKVDLTFYLGIYRGFISDKRASNKADMAYLYYLPFTMVFVSGDKLHRRTAPLFLHEDQSYLEAEEFKAALSELDEHYDALPEEIKELGVLQFASYPPSEMNNAVTRLWDKHMRSDWREIAEGQEAELGNRRGENADNKKWADVRRRIDEARPVSDQETSGPGHDPDYFVIHRQVPVKKGKWRMVSKEVEDADAGT